MPPRNASRVATPAVSHWTCPCDVLGTDLYEVTEVEQLRAGKQASTPTLLSGMGKNGTLDSKDSSSEPKSQGQIIHYKPHAVRDGNYISVLEM